MDMKSVTKGIAAGTVAGLAYYVFSAAGPMKKMSMKRNARKTLNSAGSLLSDIKSVFM